MPRITIAFLLFVACGDNNTTTVREAGNTYGLTMCTKIDECVGHIADMNGCALDIESDVCEYAARQGYSCDSQFVNPYLLDGCLAWIADSACDVEALPDVCIQAFRPISCRDSS